jgi:hypothetical protein
VAVDDGTSTQSRAAMNTISPTETIAAAQAPLRNSKMAPFITVRASMKLKTLSTPPVSRTSARVVI